MFDITLRMTFSNPLKNQGKVEEVYTKLPNKRAHTVFKFLLKIADENFSFFICTLKMISIDFLFHGFYFIQGLHFEENQ